MREQCALSKGHNGYLVTEQQLQVSLGVEPVRKYTVSKTHTEKKDIRYLISHFHFNYMLK